MSQDSAFKLLYSEVFRSGGDIASVQSKMHNQIKCYVKESFPHFLVADNYFYVPCYFTKKSVEQFKSKFGDVNITDLKSEVIIIQDWQLELAKVDSTSVFTSYAGVELKLVVKSFRLNPGKEKLSILRYPVNIYRDSEMKHWISSFVNTGLSAAVSSGVKGESLPEIAKFSGKANVSQGVVRFASGDNFSAYGIKGGNTQVMDMSAIYKSEKGALKAPSSPGKSVKPKVKGGSKAIKKKSPQKGGNVADKLSKFTPGGKKAVPKKSVGGVGTSAMASPGDKMSEGATADVKTMKQFKRMVEFLKKNKNKGGKKSVGVKGGKASRK